MTQPTHPKWKISQIENAFNTPNLLSTKADPGLPYEFTTLNHPTVRQNQLAAAAHIIREHRTMWRTQEKIKMQNLKNDFYWIWIASHHKVKKS